MRSASPVYGVDRADLGAVLDRHRAFATQTLADDGRVRRAAATKLVDVYNQRWRERTRDALTPEDLAKELVLTSIRLPSAPDGGPFLVFRATSWVFAGHGVHLALTSTYEEVQ